MFLGEEAGSAELRAAQRLLRRAQSPAGHGGGGGREEEGGGVGLQPSAAAAAAEMRETRRDPSASYYRYLVLELGQSPSFPFSVSQGVQPGP